MRRRLVHRSLVIVTSGLLMSSVLSCTSLSNSKNTFNNTQMMNSSQQALGSVNKPVIYQTLPRLFGNTKTTNKPWGTLEENGVGKFSDFTPPALKAIKQLGTTHIWYTGIPHHAVIRDYTAYGITNDDPDVVKGRAGSPYAVKDYYNVSPDLADDVSQRLQEFEALIARTHQAGMQVMIDIVPNHVARKYGSITNPTGVVNFGANDNKNLEYAKHNNFYYVLGQAFVVPEGKDGYLPLAGEPHPLNDGKFNENPAKWTGNGSRAAQPDVNDWYETVKINYGVKPDGSYDFPKLPAEYAQKSYAEHLVFWQQTEVPDSWNKYLAIALYWLDKGVDGFRFDVAEMVPVEFWSYLNSHIKLKNPNALLLAEIYNPSIYRDYIHLGKMDYLYDKVGTYDSLRAIVQGEKGTDELVLLQQSLQDIDQYLLRFLENHDEQRIAHDAFAGYAEKAKPAMVYSALIGRSATMLYFGQELGEAGLQDLGFGDPSRTTIFDYAGVPAHQRWMNWGKFDGGQLTAAEKSLQQFYQRLLSLSASHPAFQGNYADLHQFNRKQETSGYNDKLFAFARWQGDQRVIVVMNFSEQAKAFDLQLPKALIDHWQIKHGQYPLTDLLSEQTSSALNISNEKASISLTLSGLESVVLKW